MLAIEKQNCGPSGVPEEFPFYVYVADLEKDGLEICSLRARAYARHSYEAAHVHKLQSLDDSDRRAEFLVARDKQTNSMVGVARMRCSLDGKMVHHEGLNLSELGAESYAYSDRFGADYNYAHADLVVLALLKAVFYWSAVRSPQWLVTCALRPMVRRYRRAGLRMLKGSERGFVVPSQYPDPYYSIGERMCDLTKNIARSVPALVSFYIVEKSPDLRMPVPTNLNEYLVEKDDADVGSVAALA